jgi:hypothetical protein
MEVRGTLEVQKLKHYLEARFSDSPTGQTGTGTARTTGTTNRERRGDEHTKRRSA